MFSALCRNKDIVKSVIRYLTDMYSCRPELVSGSRVHVTRFRLVGRNDRKTLC